MKKSSFLLAGVLMCAAILGGCGTSNNDASVSSQKTATMETETIEVSTIDDAQKTEEPVEVTENTLYFSCNTNEKNTPGCVPANEAEGEGIDCFFVSEEYLFLDDTVGNRILVYKDFTYDHEIPLSENQDVQDMFYDSDDNVLKTIYENKNNTDSTHYYYMEISVEDSSITADKELSDAQNILLDFYFDAAGNLNTHFKGDESTEEKLSIYSKIKEILPNNYECECCYENIDTGESIYSVFDDKNGRDRSSILLFENEEIAKYAVPQEYLVVQSRLKKMGGNLYELVPEEDKIEIYMLAEKDLLKHKLENYILACE